VAVVTGAGGQIGRRLMADLEAGGSTVVGLDLPGTLPEGDGRYLVCDITDEDQVRDTFAAVRDRHGRLDLLIHCAGLSAIGRFEDHDLDMHRRVMEVTHLGAVACTLAALPDLRRSRGRVVLIGSVAGFAPVLGRPPYVAAKHAVTGLFTALRAELRADGVGVTIVHPTFVTGGMAEVDRRSQGTQRVTTGEELTPQDVSTAVFDGVVRGSDLVLVGRTARLAWYANRFAPRVYSALMERRLRAGAPRTLPLPAGARPGGGTTP
jgi:NAD(P)-dependent dehydrogenase (short-subunit alcohol dehydrogenase family)